MHVQVGNSISSSVRSKTGFSQSTLGSLRYIPRGPHQIRVSKLLYHMISAILSTSWFVLIFFRLQNILLPVQSKIEFDEEGDIDETLNGLKQDDPYLVDVLKDYYLMSPSSGPYKIDKKFLRSPLIDVIYLSLINIFKK